MRSQRLGAFVLLAAFGSFMSGHAEGAVTVTPASGHPIQPVTISGTSFGDNEAVDVYVDTVDTLLLVASATGTFTGSVTIPASAQPGKHYITAIGRHSGDAAQVVFTVSTQWTQLGFGTAHLGWNPYENTLNTSNVGSLGPLWQINANGLGDAPAVTNGRVFFGTGGGVEAVAATTGSLLWRAVPTGRFYASPTVIGSQLYIGDGFSPAMYDLNVGTGAVIWSQAAGGAFQSSAAVVGGIVYAGSVDDKVYAFSASTGKIIWTYTTGGFIDSSPAVVNGVVYIGSNDDSLYALNAATGALIWSYKTGNAVESAPAVSNGVVFVGSDDEKVYAINAAGPNLGSVLWSYTTGGAVYGSPAVAYGYVYVGATDGKMYALNAHTGALQWSLATGGTAESAVVANGVVYFSSRSGTLFALDALYGETLASGSAGYAFLGSPTVSDGILYFNTFGYNTYAISLLAGTNVVPRPPTGASVLIAASRYEPGSQSLTLEPDQIGWNRSPIPVDMCLML